jgi:cytochrome c-type protein NapC/trimethylamine-N-oxide reductase cytochrome c-type subunit TorC
MKSGGLDCHKNLVHNQRGVYAFKQYRPPYRGLGL